MNSVSPKSFEAFYARARANRDMGQCVAALQDLEEATRLAPSNKDIQKVLHKVRQEIRLEESGSSALCSGLRSVPSDFSFAIDPSVKENTADVVMTSSTTSQDKDEFII
jgi:hypothetical protein